MLIEHVDFHTDDEEIWCYLHEEVNPEIARRFEEGRDFFNAVIDALHDFEFSDDLDGLNAWFDSYKDLKRFKDLSEDARRAERARLQEGTAATLSDLKVELENLSSALRQLREDLLKED